MVVHDVEALLDHFAAEVSQVLPLVALWAHGSLALGDFVVGRSDLDLIALIGGPVGSEQRLRLQQLHEALIRQHRLAVGLHCAYLVHGDVAAASRSHLTWAHRELFERPVSPVSRRELHQGGLCLLGPAPAAVLPAVTDAELADYIRGYLQDYWYPHTGQPELWHKDIWVDLGMLTLGRAVVTLQDGRLITKREALEVLAGMGAPADVLADIKDRRYGTARPPSPDWQARRAELARTYVRQGIERALGR